MSKTKRKYIEVVTAIKIKVNCIQNDWADIKCGGPPILGYDFYIDGSKESNKDKYIKFIEKTLKKYNRPLIGISTHEVKDFDKRRLWNEKTIEECIKNNPLE